jgi:hypothetical protein
MLLCLALRITPTVDYSEMCMRTGPLVRVRRCDRLMLRVLNSPATVTISEPALRIHNPASIAMLICAMLETDMGIHHAAFKSVHNHV